MKWNYRFSKHDCENVEDFVDSLKFHSDWSNTVNIIPRRSCLSGEWILPFTRSMRATVWVKMFSHDPATYYCTLKEYVLWNLTRDE